MVTQTVDTIWLDRRASKHAVRRVAAVIERRLPHGTSEHSVMGLTLATFVRELERRKSAYRIDAFPGLGYSVAWDARINPLAGADGTEVRYHV